MGEQRLAYASGDRPGGEPARPRAVIPGLLLLTGLALPLAASAEIAPGTRLTCALEAESGGERITVAFEVAEAAPPALNAAEPPQRVIVAAEINGESHEAQPLLMSEGGVVGFYLETPERLAMMAAATDGLTGGIEARFSVLTPEGDTIYLGTCEVLP